MCLSKMYLSSSLSSQKIKILVICCFFVIVLGQLFPDIITASESDIEGRWVGVMTNNGKQGDAEITITRNGESYTATYQGLPSLTGQLYNVQYKPGKKPNSMTLTMTSRINKLEQNEAVLRFYLLKEQGRPQLAGIIKLDLELGNDVDFNAVFERQPCCDSKCIHPGKSRCY